MYPLERLFKVDKVMYDRQTETICTTSDINELIRTCKYIDGDFNVTVWIDGDFEDIYMDPDENELRELFN